MQCFYNKFIYSCVLTPILLECVFYCNLQMFCIVALILVTQIIPAIDQVEDQLHEFGNGYNDAESYRSAALFLVCVSSTATAIEIFMISIRCFCLMTSSIMEKIFKFYAFVVSSNTSYSYQQYNVHI